MRRTLPVRDYTGTKGAGHGREPGGGVAKVRLTHHFHRVRSARICRQRTITTTSLTHYTESRGDTSHWVAHFARSNDAISVHTSASVWVRVSALPFARCASERNKPSLAAAAAASASRSLTAPSSRSSTCDSFTFAPARASVRLDVCERRCSISPDKLPRVTGDNGVPRATAERAGEGDVACAVYQTVDG